jgi:hypothetical protein
MNVDCAGCVGNPHACGDCSIGFLLGPVMTVTGTGSGEPEAVEMVDAIAVFAATGMLSGLRAIPGVRPGPVGEDGLAQLSGRMVG